MNFEGNLLNKKKAHSIDHEEIANKKNLTQKVRTAKYILVQKLNLVALVSFYTIENKTILYIYLKELFSHSIP